MKKLLFILFAAGLAACSKDEPIAPVPPTSSPAGFRLHSVSGEISHVFDFVNDRVETITQVGDEDCLKKQIFYKSNGQIDFVVGTTTYDDLSVKVDTTFVQYAAGRLSQTTTRNSFNGAQVTEYFTYDDLNRLSSVRQRRIMSDITDWTWIYIYNDDNNVARLELLGAQSSLFEYDDKTNPYTQIDLEVRLILGDWRRMNVFSQNNALTKTVVFSNPTLANDSTVYTYQYNARELPQSRVDETGFETTYRYE
ncbi:MAG: hypothetical protein AAGN35_12625 [Bacteroidota bacterium]